MKRLIGALIAVIGLIATSAGATSTDSFASQGALVRTLADGRTAIALRTAPPTWLTPELLQSARRRPTQAPAEAGTAIPDLPASGFVGIRPGSFEVFPYGCTMNFIFQKSGALYIGTAGHCVDNVGQEVTLLTVAPGTDNPVLVTIGTVATRNFNENQIAPDYAVIAIKPELYPWVFSTIAGVGGPCGAYTGSGLVSIPVPKVFQGQDTEIGLEQVAHYGHGLGVGTGGTPRTGVSLYWDTDAYYWDSPSAPGDSGSPVRVSTLAAAGNLTDLVIDTAHPGAFVEGTRIGTIMAAGYSLVNSPYC
jgi:hypothetical protein